MVALRTYFLGADAPPDRVDNPWHDVTKPQDDFKKNVPAGHENGVAFVSAISADIAFIRVG